MFNFESKNHKIRKSKKSYARVRDKIVEHIVNNNIFSNKQHGFVPDRDTLTNPFECMDD